MSDADERPSKIRKLDGPVDDAGGSGGGDDDDHAKPGHDEPAMNSPRPDGPTLSKRQLKKIKKQEAWDAGRELRRVKRRVKMKEKKARRAESAAAPAAAAPMYRTPSTVVPVALVLDCGFDELMNDRELVSLSSQLTRCYSANRAASCKVQLVVSSFGGRLQERFDTVLERNYHGWKGVTFTADDFVAAAAAAPTIQHASPAGALAAAAAAAAAVVDSPAPSDSAAPGPAVVYLTADSPHTLEALAPHTTYVVGGLVDKNRHKGACYKRACERGVRTARLPIAEYLTMQGRVVLATNHVVEIVLRWLELGDWARAFQEVIPKRKDARLRPADAQPAVENGGAGPGGGGDFTETDDEDGGDEDKDRRAGEGSARPMTCGSR